VNAVGITGMLSLVAKHQEPRKPLVAEAGGPKDASQVTVGQK